MVPPPKETGKARVARINALLFQTENTDARLVQTVADRDQADTNPLGRRAIALGGLIPPGKSPVSFAPGSRMSRELSMREILADRATFVSQG